MPRANWRSSSAPRRSTLPAGSKHSNGAVARAGVSCSNRCAEMPYFFAGLVILGVLILLGRAFIATDPHALVRTLRYLVFGFIFFLAERWGFALPLAAAGISALALGRIGPIDLGGGRRTAGTRSTV